MSFRTTAVESSCKRIESLLLRLPDGDLSPPEQAQVEKHLAFCEACRADAEGLQSLGGSLRAHAPSGAGLPTGAAFAAGLMQAEARRSRLPGPPSLRWAVAGVALAGAVFGGRLLFPPEPPPVLRSAPAVAAQAPAETAPMLFVVDDEDHGRRVVLTAAASPEPRKP